MIPQRRILVAFIVASLVGLLAIVLATVWLKTSNPVNTSQVVVAHKAITAGIAITADDIRMIDIAKEAIPLGAAPKGELLLGRISKVNIAAGEIILDRMLNLPGASGGLAYSITPGMRAISMGVNEISDVAGFVLPGNYVDVLLTSKDEAGRPTSKILLSRVLVMAVAQDRIIQDESKPKIASSVTLEVSPSQANLLDEGRSLGNLSLTLRNQAESNASVGSVEEKNKKTISNENGVEVIRGTTIRIESGLRGK